MILWEDTDKMHHLMNEVMHSSCSNFYAKKYAGIDVTTLDSVSDLPTLTRSELVEIHPDDRCYVSNDAIRFVAYTSGTTSGHPLLSYFAQVENYHVDPSWGSQARRPLVVFPPLNKNFGGTFVQQCAQAPIPVTPVFGDLQNMATSAVLASEARCDALYVTPSYAFALAPELKRFYDPEKIKLLVISGETIGESKLASLRALYPKAQIANLYASSEIGQFIMGPTPKMLEDGVVGFYPITDALVALELIEGELVVTYNLNPAFPLIRYATGDHFTVSEEMTSLYGAEIPVLEWNGKGGIDTVRVAGFEFRSGSVDDFFYGLPQDIEDYQLHVYANEGAIKLVLEYVAKQASTTTTSLIQERFIDTFIVAKSGTLQQALEEGTVDSVEVKPVQSVSVVNKKRRVLVSHVV